MKKFISTLTILFSVFLVTPAVHATQDVSADANLAGGEGAHFQGDFTLTVPSGALDDGALDDGIAVTTATNNTGSVGFSGTSTVTGSMGTASTGLLRRIAGGNDEQTVTFSNNVFATTTNLAGNGTLTFADNANITSAITTTTNNTGSLNFLGTSLVTGQVGTSSAKVSTIVGGGTGENVTFSTDVYATTTRVIGAGTLTFNGDVTSAINFNAGGDAVFADGSDLVGAVTTSANNSGSVFYNGASSITTAMGSVAGNDLNRVVIQGGIVTLNSGTDYAVTTTTVRTNTAAGLSGTMKLGQNSTITGMVLVNGAGAFDASTYVGTLTDDFEIASGATLKTTVTTSGASSSTAGHVVASTAAGDARVSSGSTLDVNVTPGYVSNGTVFMLVDGNSGGGLVEAPGTTSDNSATLTFTPSVTGNDLVMTATRANLGALATNPTGQAVGTTLNEFSSGASGDIATVIANLDTLPSAQAYTDAINQLDPDMNGGVNQASFNSTGGALNTVNTRLDNARNGMAAGNGQNGISTGDEFSDVGIWTQGFGTYGDQDDKDGISGYTASTWGAAGGFDFRLDERTRLGLSFAFSQSDVDSNNNSSNTDVDSYQGTMYGSYDGDPWYLDAMFAVGWNTYEGSRVIQFASINRTAQQDYDGMQYSTKFTFGYPLAIADGWSLVPVASLLYSHLDIDSFTETGAASLNLSVAGQDYDFLQQGLGAKIVTEWVDGGNQKWVPSFHVLWLYDYIGDKASSTSTFTAGGSAFTTDGLEPDQSSLNAGAGITVYPTEALSLNVSYDFQGSSDYTGHSGSATLRYEY